MNISINIPDIEWLPVEKEAHVDNSRELVDKSSYFVPEFSFAEDNISTFVCDLNIVKLGEYLLHHFVIV